MKCNSYPHIWLANRLSKILMNKNKVCLYCIARLFTESMTFPNIDGSVWWARLNARNFSHFRSKLESNFRRERSHILCQLLKRDQYGCKNCKHQLNLKHSESKYLHFTIWIKICIYIKDMNTAFQNNCFKYTILKSIVVCNISRRK